MTHQTIDKNLLKSVLIEVLEEREDLLVKALELFLKKKSTISEQETSKNELELIVNKHFNKYDEVFKALS